MGRKDLPVISDNENPLLDAIASPPDDPVKPVQPVINLDSIEGIYETIGAVKAFKFRSRMDEFYIAVILKDLKESKKYKQAGIKNFAELCARLGISKATGENYVKNISAYGTNTYADMLKCGIKDKHMKMLRNSSLDIQVETGPTKKTTIKVEEYGEVEVTKENKGLIEEILSEKEKQIKTEREKTKREREKLEKAEIEIQDLRKAMEPLSTDEKKFQKRISEYQVKFMSSLKELTELSEIAQLENNLSIQFTSMLQWLDGYYTQFREKLW